MRIDKTFRELIIMLAVIGVAIAVAVAVAALPADGQTGVDEAWTSQMNQESYWENRFGPGADCTKWENHSGGGVGSYEAVVVKDGTRVRVYDPNTQSTVIGPVNPANGQHHGAPHSWVMKCNITPPVTTTTVPETTTTTVIVTTTTVPETTTTTVPEPTTTTTVPETTTTTEQGTTTTTVAESTTTTIVVTTPTVPDELPYTGIDTRHIVLFGIAFGALGVLGACLGRKWKM